MKFHLLTLFPDLLNSALSAHAGLLGKARHNQIIEVLPHDMRQYGAGPYNKLDDAPYGGGPGLLMFVEAWVKAMETIRSQDPSTHTVLLCADGPLLTQSRVRTLAEKPSLTLLCPRYEGVDARVEHFVDETLCIGDYVLSGGDYAALIVIDAVSRLLPGMLGNLNSTTSESFSHPGRLEYAQYTRPPEFRGLKVPDVLLSGDHAKIKQFRQRSSLERTLERRPELITQYPLTPEELKF